MPPARKPRPTLTLDERVAVLESELAELSRLLREHMLREERTTETLMDALASIERRISAWRGIAIGVSLAVSAVWSVVVALMGVLR